MPSPTSSPATVSRRHVFYIDGFDPKGPAHHHAFYSQQAKLQEAVSGMTFQISERTHREGHAQWTVTGQEGGHTTETVYEFLRWDDIVRQHWARGSGALLRELARAGMRYLPSGAWLRIARQRPASQWAAMLPVAATLLSLALALMAAAIAWWLTRSWGPVAAACGIAAGGLVLGAAAAVERRVSTGWLTRIYAFTCKQASGEVDGLEERLDAFAGRIALAAGNTGVDEVLVVGYSTGSIVAVSAAARAAASLGSSGRPINLLTLAQCTPLLSALPKAHRFRAELALLASQPRVQWTDVASAVDWGAFPELDPLAFAGISGPNHPRLVSPRFHTLFEPQAWARHRRNKRRVHLQYLMAADLPGVYDYFAITAGGRRLEERLAP